MSQTKNNFLGIVRNPFKSLFAIYTLTFISFSNIFKNDFILDDFSFIVNWPLIRDLKNFPQFFVGYVPPVGQEGIYAPLKTLFHAIFFQMFEYNLTGYHILSLAIHFSVIYWVYKIIQLISKNDVVTFFATLFFALHPVHTEAITSITASIDTIGTVFMFVSFYFYIRQDGQAPSSQVKKGYILSWLFALLAICTQELTAALPFLILLYDICLSKEAFGKRDLLKKVFPFVLIVALYLGCKWGVLGGISRGKYIYDSFYLTFLVSIKALAQYVLLIFFPIVLTHNHVISKGIYSFDVPDFQEYYVLTQSIVDPQVVCSILLVGGILYAAYKCWGRKNLVSFSILWFFVGLLPAMNLIPSSVYFAERYLYIPSLGFSLLMGLYFNRLYEGKGKIGQIRYAHIALILVGVISLGYGFRLWARNHEMRNNISMYHSAIRANPQSALMRNDLGIVYTEYNLPEMAIKSFEQSLKIKESPVTYFAMAEAYAVMGQNEKTETALKTAIAKNPKFADAYFNLASLYAFWARTDQAREYLDKALSLYAERGDTDKVKYYQEVFEGYFGELKKNSDD